MKSPGDIVITGMGTITPIGLNLEDFPNNLTGGVSGADYIRSFDTDGFRSKIACEVKGFNPGDYIDR